MASYLAFGLLQVVALARFASTLNWSQWTSWICVLFVISVIAIASYSLTKRSHGGEKSGEAVPPIGLPSHLSFVVRYRRSSLKLLSRVCFTAPSSCLSSRNVDCISH